MKILILPDLHLEFLPLVPDETTAGVVVLAGDIDLGADGIAWGRRSYPGKEIVHIAGNHEFYGQDWERLNDQLREQARKQAVHFIEGSPVDIAWVRFLGAALWADFDLFGADRRTEAMHSARDYMYADRIAEIQVACPRSEVPA